MTAATSLATKYFETYRQPKRTTEIVNGKAEFTFENISELCAFVAREIALSKQKYSKFAEKCDLAHGTVSRMAHGVTQHPRAETVFAMLRVLGYEVVVRR